MENEKQNQIKKDYILLVSIAVSAIILAVAWIYATGLKTINTQQKMNNAGQTAEPQRQQSSCGI